MYPFLLVLFAITFTSSATLYAGKSGRHDPSKKEHVLARKGMTCAAKLIERQYGGPESVYRGLEYLKNIGATKGRGKDSLREIQKECEQTLRDFETSGRECRLVEAEEKSALLRKANAGSGRSLASLVSTAVNGYTTCQYEKKNYYLEGMQNNAWFPVTWMDMGKHPLIRCRSPLGRYYELRRHRKLKSPSFQAIRTLYDKIPDDCALKYPMKLLSYLETNQEPRLLDRPEVEISVRQRYRYKPGKRDGERQDSKPEFRSGLPVFFQRELFSSTRHVESNPSTPLYKLQYAIGIWRDTD